MSKHRALWLKWNDFQCNQCFNWYYLKDNLDNGMVLCLTFNISCCKKPRGRKKNQRASAGLIMKIFWRVLQINLRQPRFKCFEHIHSLSCSSFKEKSGFSPIDFFKGQEYSKNIDTKPLERAVWTPSYNLIPQRFLKQAENEPHLVRQQSVHIHSYTLFLHRRHCHIQYGWKYR